MPNQAWSRRKLLANGFITVMGLPIANQSFANGLRSTDAAMRSNYPALEAEVMEQVVGASHTNLERVKELVSKRPELAKATWDWGYGDIESALGACSHTGRRDIAEYLMQHGATPNIFTLAMMGELTALRAMVTAFPAMAAHAGPHGITLLRHAEIGLQSGAAPKEAGKQTVEFIQSLTAGAAQKEVTLSDDMKKMYPGDYRYGQGEAEGFSIRINMRGMLSLGRLGKSGGGLIPQGDHVFQYNGAPSTKIVFTINNNAAIALEITEPGYSIKALRVAS